jgi:hypothetical protein
MEAKMFYVYVVPGSADSSYYRVLTSMADVQRFFRSIPGVPGPSVTEDTWWEANPGCGVCVTYARLATPSESSLIPADIRRIAREICSATGTATIEEVWDMCQVEGVTFPCELWTGTNWILATVLGGDESLTVAATHTDGHRTVYHNVWPGNVRAPGGDPSPRWRPDVAA